uniref:NADH-ubiquinone oxidoreductase chain 3 n=1 Tax=Crassostrea tulipa TaxID=2912563 RepID=A0A0K0PWG9_9BIVA|nr:NADH dehydrogenase subunit 3 [Crassostrea gasar]AKQ78440.1 NADH dehydrogenase subunit 3 [Crassostrea gasar]
MKSEFIIAIGFLSVAPTVGSMFLTNLISSSQDWDKASPYECGFATPGSPGDFSSRFFHLVILFLVWDVEIVLLVPCFQDLAVWSIGNIALAAFLLVLTLGLFYEITEGTIKWTMQES